MLEEHKDVFKDELGTMKGVKAKLFVKPGSSPKFFKPTCAQRSHRTRVRSVREYGSYGKGPPFRMGGTDRSSS